MEMVEHLWNITQFLVSNKNSAANELRNYYTQCCRELSDEVALPTSIFGPNTMCTYCGTLWSTVDYKVKIVKGTGLSNSIKKLVHNSNRDTSHLTKCQKQLMQRCISKQSNKLIILCPYCNKKNQILLNKPKRQKAFKKIPISCVTPRKNKKRNKNKTAGLLIHTPNNFNDSRNNEYKNGSNDTSNENTNNDNRNKKLLNINKSTKKRKFSTTITSSNKSKKIDIAKLKGIIHTTITPSKKTNLHSFLNELG